MTRYLPPTGRRRQLTRQPGRRDHSGDKGVSATLQPEPVDPEEAEEVPAPVEDETPEPTEEPIEDPSLDAEPEPEDDDSGDDEPSVDDEPEAEKPELADEKTLKKMLKADLVTLATVTWGVTVADNDTKAMIIEKLQAAAAE